MTLPTQQPPITIESVVRPELLHEWYLEATRELRPESYNPKAQKPYEEMTDEQKQIDIFICDKIRATITSLLQQMQKEIKDKKSGPMDFRMGVEIHDKALETAAQIIQTHIGKE